MALAGHCPAVLVPPAPELEELLDALVAPPLPLALVLPVVAMELLLLPVAAVLELEAPPVPVPFDSLEPALHAAPAGRSTASRATRRRDDVMVIDTMLAQSVNLKVHSLW